MKMQTIAKKIRKALKGFSLVEMLVVIAVIGVITAIAVPSISSITSEAEIAKNQRNAQNIASVYNAAIAAGADTTELSRTDVGQAITQLSDADGVPGTGSFENAEFICDIEADESAAAQGYLVLTNGVMTLNFTP